METEHFLTVDEVAAILRVSRWSVSRYIRAGALKAVKGDGPNGPVRVPVGALAAYIEAHTIHPEPEGR